MKKLLFEELYEKIIKEDAETIYPSSLDGMKKDKARKRVNNLFSEYTRGFFSDDYWRQVHKIFKVLDENDISYTLIKSFYDHDENGTPNSKTWVFEIRFLNEKNEPISLYGRVVASGAGSVKNPLDRYDVVAYVS